VIPQQPFPEVVNSSLLAQLKSCQTKAQFGSLLHFQSRNSSEHLVAGKAFASGLEAGRKLFYVEGRPAAEAIAAGWEECVREYGRFDPPEDSPKSWSRTAGALEYYFEAYPLGADGAKPHVFGSGTHGIEFSFVEPLPVAHPTTGQPILFSGRLDMVADAFGGVFAYDEKTTGQLGAKWIHQWEHRSQFTSYCWGMRQAGLRATGCVVRGVAIRKEGYDTLQAITYRAEWEVERWLRETVWVLEDWIAAWKRNEFRHNLDDGCNAYGGCMFTRACKSRDPGRWLEADFVRRAWDPVKRIETDLPSLGLSEMRT
jgi:hypothetical protein